MVNFQDYIGRLTFHFGEVVNVFLDNNSIVKGSSFLERTSLALSNDEGLVGLDPIGYDICNDFLLGNYKVQ